jgi:ABC-type lipoprotein release transport system permease subunit
VTFVSTSVLLLVLGTAASLMPARRAAKTDPLRVLREG